MDEAGIAQWDADFISTTPAQAHQYLLKRAALYPPDATLSVAPLSASGFQLSLQGQSGPACQVQASTTLANWSPIGTVIATNAPVLFLDTAATPPGASTGRLRRNGLLS